MQNYPMKPSTPQPEFPEDWDAFAQMAAIIMRTSKFNRSYLNATDYAREISAEVSDLAFRDGVKAGIAYERQRCINVCQAIQPSGGRAWTPEQLACFNALSTAADHIKDGTNPWAGST